MPEMLSYSAYVDSAWHLYQQTENPKPLQRTGTVDRIDQVWTSLTLAPTVVDYKVLDAPKGASNHNGLWVRLDASRAVADEEALWDYK